MLGFSHLWNSWGRGGQGTLHSDSYRVREGEWGLGTLQAAPTVNTLERRYGAGEELELPEGREEEAVIAYLGDEADNKVSNSE